MQASSVHKATFAGGCFYGPELLFQRVPGVIATKVSYSQVAITNRLQIFCISASLAHMAVGTMQAYSALA